MNFEKFAEIVARLGWMEARWLRDSHVEIKVGSHINVIVCDTPQEAQDFADFVNGAREALEFEDAPDVPERFENSTYKLNVEVPVVDGVVQCVEVNGVLIDGPFAEMFIQLAGVDR